MYGVGSWRKRKGSEVFGEIPNGWGFAEPPVLKRSPRQLTRRADEAFPRNLEREVESADHGEGEGPRIV